MTAAKHALAEGDFALAAKRLVFARDAEPAQRRGAAPDDDRVLAGRRLLRRRARRARLGPRRARAPRAVPHRRAHLRGHGLALSQALDAAERETARAPARRDRVGAARPPAHAPLRPRAARATRSSAPARSRRPRRACSTSRPSPTCPATSARRSPPASRPRELAPDSRGAWSRYAHALARTDRTQDCLAACERALALARRPRGPRPARAGPRAGAARARARIRRGLGATPLFGTRPGGREEAALGRVRRQLERAAYAAAASARAALAPQQVGARGVQQVVVVERAARSASISASPAPGPSAIATATARLSSTTGRRQHARQLAVEQGDLAPVGRLGARRLGVHARRSRPAARTAPAGGAASARGRRAASASPIAPRSQRARSCSSSSTSSPSAPMRAARREWCSSISASRPAGSGSSGSSTCDDARQPDRLGGEVVAHQRVAGRRRVALVEDQVEHGEHGAAAAPAARRAAARRSGCPAVADLPLRPHEPLRHRRSGQRAARGRSRAR